MREFVVENIVLSCLALPIFFSLLLPHGRSSMYLIKSLFSLILFLPLLQTDSYAYTCISLTPPLTDSVRAAPAQRDALEGGGATVHGGRSEFVQQLGLRAQSTGAARTRRRQWRPDRHQLAGRHGASLASTRYVLSEWGFPSPPPFFFPHLTSTDHSYTPSGRAYIPDRGLGPGLLWGGGERDNLEPREPDAPGHGHGAGFQPHRDPVPGGQPGPVGTACESLLPFFIENKRRGAM